MSTHTKYGACCNCSKFVKRDDMTAINAKCYDAENEETKVPIRLCVDCFGEVIGILEGLRWKNVLYTEGELLESGALPASTEGGLTNASA